MTIGFFYEDETAKSMSRLCCFLGVIFGGISGLTLTITSIWLTWQPNWALCALPFSLMIGGCVPFVCHIAREGKNDLLKNPELIARITEIIKRT